jgi:hypothetical protein
VTKSDKESERGVRKRESEKKRKGAGEEERGGEGRKRERAYCGRCTRQAKKTNIFI